MILLFEKEKKVMYFHSFSLAQRKRTKRNIHPTKAFPQGKDAIDYEGNPLRQSFGIARKAFAPSGRAMILYRLR